MIGASGSKGLSGRAASNRSGFGPVVDDDSRDVQPRFLCELVEDWPQAAQFVVHEASDPMACSEQLVVALVSDAIIARVVGVTPPSTHNVRMVVVEPEVLDADALITQFVGCIVGLIGVPLGKQFVP